jgi:hypothetical protein
MLLVGEIRFPWKFLVVEIDLRPNLSCSVSYATHFHSFPRVTFESLDSSFCICTYKKFFILLQTFSIKTNYEFPYFFTENILQSLLSCKYKEKYTKTISLVQCSWVLITMGRERERERERERGLVNPTGSFMITQKKSKKMKMKGERKKT